MPRMKSLNNLSVAELKELADALAAEESRRQLLSAGSEAIKSVIEGINQVAKNLKVSPKDLIQPIVESILGDGYAVYAKRGRAANKSTSTRKPGRPRKAKK